MVARHGRYGATTAAAVTTAFIVVFSLCLRGARAEGKTTWVNQVSAKYNGEVFLRGLYVELGVHSAGSFGTANLPPSYSSNIGFHGKAGATTPWGYGA